MIAGALALSLLVGGAARAAEPSAPVLPFALKEIGPGVYAAIDGPQHKAGSNAGFIVGDDGVVVVDAFQSQDAAKALLGEIRRITPKPIRYLVNTHYHFDHTGGDQVFRDAGAQIIAHRNVRGWVRAENPHLFGPRITPEAKAAIAALPLPDVTTTGEITLWLGVRRVEIGSAPGHTGGDLIVAVRDAHAIFCGDMVWSHFAPNIIDGSVKQWIATDQALLALPNAGVATYVPGHGDVAKAADVSAFIGYLIDLRAYTEEGIRSGLSGDALTTLVLAKLKAKYGDWTYFEVLSPRAVGFMADELNGTKLRPTPVAD
jgi:glyoxylase-like metal-dependent hydrolase (beta-lactamase superfamily II)